MSPDPPRRARFGEWLERRVGWRRLMHEGLDEPVPGGSRWAYVFGSGLLFLFMNQAVTGVCLSLYYVPSSDHAHETVAYIQKQVAGGEFLRSLHAYGSSVMVVILLLHLAQTFLYGAYKSCRELLWLVGCFLFLVVLGMSFTGYLLPWDQKAYSATAVATNLIAEIPLVGRGLQALLRGGHEMGTLTLSRFFTLHVFVLPATIAGAVALHVFLFRRAGAAGPPVSDEQRAKLPVRPFFPDQVIKDFVFGVAVIVLLGGLAYFRPVLLGPMANPGDPTYLPRPEWYYLPIFQWLKYWHGGASVIGMVVIPILLLLTLFALPFIDRSPERRPWRRPKALGIFLSVLGGLFWLGLRSHSEDLADPAVRARLAAQAREERRFARAPFVPEESAGQGACSIPIAAAHALSPEEAKGALLFVSESCSGCHGPEGKGGAGQFRLVDLNQRFPGDQLTTLLRHPNPTMLEGGMAPVELKEPDFDSLVGYLRAVTANRDQ